MRLEDRQITRNPELDREWVKHKSQQIVDWCFEERERPSLDSFIEDVLSHLCVDHDFYCLSNQEIQDIISHEYHVAFCPEYTYKELRWEDV